MTVHNVLRDEHPAVLERLYRGYSFHRRGEEQPGELAYTPYRVPVYSNTEGKVSARYVRTYVEAGEAAAGRPMGEAELAVLDRFEEVTKRAELMLEFTLQPGEMYFINNYTVLHARTAFDEGDAETTNDDTCCACGSKSPGCGLFIPISDATASRRCRAERRPTIGAN